MKWSGKLLRRMRQATYRTIRTMTYGVPFRRPYRWRMTMKARTLARPRRKISGHHRI